MKSTALAASVVVSLLVITFASAAGATARMPGGASAKPTSGAPDASPRT